LVNVTKKPISVADDAEKTHIMPGSATAPPVDSEDPNASEPTTGKTRSLTATG